MGLSGPKKRTKLSSDPNNTAWSKSTDTFGHKILSAQGWKPGDLLGAKDAAHSEHFTAANASHIKVMLREDNLGLGAKLGRDSAETFGLSTLSGIFGRLNGKSDEDIEKQRSLQRDVELRAYQTQKYGLINFVRGGLLVGDKMEDIPVLKAAMSQSKAAESSAEQPTSAEVLARTKVKKRKREDGTLTEQTAATAEGAHDPIYSADESSRKKKKKRHDGAAATAPTLSQPKTKAKRKDQADLHADVAKADRKRSRHTSMQPVSPAAAVVGTGAADDNAAVSEQRTDKAARRAAKAARKEERAKRREERKKHKSSRSTSSDTTSQDNETKDAGPSTKSAFAGSRQAVRQRWIQQKRLASMDSRALNEILMLKTAVT